MRKRNLRGVLHRNTQSTWHTIPATVAVDKPNPNCGWCRRRRSASSWSNWSQSSKDQSGHFALNHNPLKLHLFQQIYPVLDCACAGLGDWRFFSVIFNSYNYSEKLRSINIKTWSVLCRIHVLRWFKLYLFIYFVCLFVSVVL